MLLVLALGIYLNTAVAADLTSRWEPHLAACEYALLGRTALPQLREQFVSNWSYLQGQNAQFVAEDLLSRYTDPRRGSYGIAYLWDFLNKLDAYLRANPRDESHRTELVVAAFFSHAVHETGPETFRTDNSAESSILFTSQAAGMSRERVEEIRDLILSTRYHNPKTHFEDVFCDIDLSMFAAKPADFARFENGIRYEYDWMDEPTYREWREQQLAQYVSRRPLYRTRFFRRLYEGQATVNFERALY